MIDEEWVELADAVRVVREQLESAREAGEGEKIRFEVGAVEIEFAVAVTKDARARGGVRLGVLTVGANTGVSAATTHRVTLTLTPTRDGTSLQVSGSADDLPPRPGSPGARP